MPAGRARHDDAGRAARHAAEASHGAAAAPLSHPASTSRRIYSNFGPLAAELEDASRDAFRRRRHARSRRSRTPRWA